MDISNPAFRRALEDVEKLNTPHQWAIMRVTEWPETIIHGVVNPYTCRIYIDYGTIHQNYESERAIATWEYAMHGDFVSITKQTHS